MEHEEEMDKWGEQRYGEIFDKGMWDIESCVIPPGMSLVAAWMMDKDHL